MPRLLATDIGIRYLEEVKNSQWATGSDVDSSNEGQSLWGILKDVGKDLLAGFGKTDMDAALLFEQTLLHELTHHRVVGMTQSSMRETESYGWSECVEAASATNSGIAIFPGN